MATEPDNVDNGVLGTLILVLSFGVLGTALAVTALARTEEDALMAERSDANDQFMELRGAQEADLNLPVAYVDEKAGTVRLPIDRAMQLVVRDLRRDPRSATPEAPLAAEAEGGLSAGSGASEKEADPTPGAEGAKRLNEPGDRSDVRGSVNAPAPAKAPPERAPRPTAPKPAAPAPKPPPPAGKPPAPANPAAPAKPPAPKPTPAPGPAGAPAPNP